MNEHPEAFRLMQYDADDGSETEVIWNSRDGVTPFVITLASGKSGTHSRFGEDVVCNEGMARALGVRWFIDHTDKTARYAAVEYVDRFWAHPDYPMSRMWDRQTDAVNHFIQEWIGGPTVVDSPGPPEIRPIESKFGERHVTPEELLEICRTKHTTEALEVLRNWLPDNDKTLVEDPDGSPYLDAVQEVWAEMPERLRLPLVDALEAEVGYLRTRIQKFIDRHVHGALRWEEPLPIPPQILELQEVLDDDAYIPIVPNDGCRWCMGEREPLRRT